MPFGYLILSNTRCHMPKWPDTNISFCSKFEIPASGTRVLKCCNVLKRVLENDLISATAWFDGLIINTCVQIPINSPWAQMFFCLFFYTASPYDSGNVPLDTMVLSLGIYCHFRWKYKSPQCVKKITSRDGATGNSVLYLMFWNHKWIARHPLCLSFIISFIPLRIILVLCKIIYSWGFLSVATHHGFIVIRIKI